MDMEECILVKSVIANFTNILELNKYEGMLKRRVENANESLKWIPIRRKQIENTKINQIRMDF